MTAGRCQRARLGGARADDARGAAPQRERGPEYVVVLVSERFDGVPWLERVYQCGALWDAAEMGDHADVHCYTPLEYERKRESLPLVRTGQPTGIRPAGRVTERRYGCLTVMAPLLSTPLLLRTQSDAAW